VTRNYQDFAPLVEELARRNRTFPGVLFLSPAIPPPDLAAHVRALTAWTEAAGEGNPVRSTYGWVAPA